MMDLEAGRLDVVVVDEVVGRYVNKKPDNYVGVGRGLRHRRPGVGFRKDDEATSQQAQRCADRNEEGRQGC